ncbi:conserved hypothetical protein [Streptococcus equi subsp. zooepidemicus ATCC 35246]|nr:conserved hypothetical protein [Streptococcus equi subsp. zooepidemicus ATCC 35246]AIA68534.1 hypothetical protein Q426_00885 [Streptococcus equi subsp. zooepidemicus CY]
MGHQDQAPKAVSDVARHIALGASRKKLTQLLQLLALDQQSCAKPFSKRAFMTFGLK